jgi:hypothetical protein
VKPRLIAYVEPRLHAQVTAAGAKPGWSQSAVIEAALRYFFSNVIEHERDALLIKRLDDLNRRLARMERDQQAHIELCDVGVHLQLILGPRLNAEAWAIAVAQARPMFDFYRKALKDRLAPGRKLLGQALADAVFSEDDFHRLATPRREDGAHGPFSPP